MSDYDNNLDVGNADHGPGHFCTCAGEVHSDSCTNFKEQYEGRSMVHHPVRQVVESQFPFVEPHSGQFEPHGNASWNTLPNFNPYQTIYASASPPPSSSAPLFSQLHAQNSHFTSDYSGHPNYPNSAPQYTLWGATMNHHQDITTHGQHPSYSPHLSYGNFNQHFTSQQIDSSIVDPVREPPRRIVPPTVPAMPQRNNTPIRSQQHAGSVSPFLVSASSTPTEEDEPINILNSSLTSSAFPQASIDAVEGYRKSCHPQDQIHWIKPAYDKIFKSKNELKKLIGDLHPPITFQCRETPFAGINIMDAFERSRSWLKLKDADDSMDDFVHTYTEKKRCTAMVRVALHTTQLAARDVPSKDKELDDNTSNNGAPRRSVLVAKVAKSILYMIIRANNINNRPPNAADGDIELPGEILFNGATVNILVKDIYIMSLHHISKGSWQVHLRVRHAGDRP